MTTANLDLDEMEAQAALCEEATILFSTVGWPIALLAKYIDVLSSGGPASWTDIVLWPSAVFVIVAIMEGWVLTPWIQSETMEMSALIVLIAVIVGGAVGGALGMLMAIPIAACGKIILEELWKGQRRMAAARRIGLQKLLNEGRRF